jgi:hypothetical protein
VAATSMLDMDPSREDSTDETCLDRRRRHTGDHDGRFAEQTGVRCVEVKIWSHSERVIEVDSLRISEPTKCASVMCLKVKQNFHTVLRVINWDAQLLGSPQLLASQILCIELIRRTRQVLRMEWSIDNQKPHGEHKLPLREERLVLVLCTETAEEKLTNGFLGVLSE